MKTFKDIIEEATTEINQLPRRSKAFVDKHVVQKTDYPVDAEDQFTAKKLKKDKTKLASFHDGDDAAVYEETDLDEGVSNLSDARLKFHVLKDIPHGRYTKKEMAAEHDRRKKTGGAEYNAVKPSMNEEVDLDEAAKTDIYHKHMLKALGKTRLPKDHGYTSSIANNGDFVVRKGGEVAGRIPKGEHNLKEASMTPTDMKQREDIVKGMKKSAQDFKDRYGSKWKSVMYATATKAAMKEDSEQIDELSNEKKMAYGKAAFADYHKQSKAKLGKILSGDKDTSGESRKIANRLKGISTSSKSESVELDEISRDLARRYIRKVADKNNTGEASPKEVMKRSPGVALAGKKAYGIGGKAKVNATEEVEQIDELSANTLHSYTKKAALSLAGNASSVGAAVGAGKKPNKDLTRYTTNRIKGITSASGRLADKANSVSEDLDEAFKAGSMKLNDGSSVTLTSESSNSLNNLFNQLSSQNKTKMEQRLMSGSKGFNEILAFAKEV